MILDFQCYACGYSNGSEDIKILNKVTYRNDEQCKNVGDNNISTVLCGTRCVEAYNETILNGGVVCRLVD